MWGFRMGNEWHSTVTLFNKFTHEEIRVPGKNKQTNSNQPGGGGGGGAGAGAGAGGSARELAQWLRALAAIPQDPGSIPSSQ